MKLYEIDQQIAAIFEAMTIDEETGEVILDTEALEALQEERTRKLEGAALMVRNLEAEAKAIEAEADRLTARQKAAKNKAKRIREWLGFALGDEKLKTSMVSVSPIKPKPTAVIDDPWAVQGWFVRDIIRDVAWADMSEEQKGEFRHVSDLLDRKDPAPQYSKAGIKKLIDEGYVIDGVHIEAGKPSAQIR